MSNDDNRRLGSGVMDQGSAAVRARGIRRRRTARTAAIGGGVLAVIGGSVLGSTHLAAASLSAPLPAWSEQSTSERTASDADQPELLAGTALECGANIADLDFAEKVRLDATGDLTTESVHYEGEWSDHASLPLRAADAAGDAASEQDLNSPTFVWATADGTVVDIGAWDRYPMYLTHEDTGPQAQEDWTSTCAPEGGDPWLPDGEYEVYPMTVEYSTGTLVAGDPIEATIEDGRAHWAPGGQEAPVPFEVPGDPDETLVPERAFGSALVDRTGTWERRNTYRVAWPEADLVDGERYELTARCTSSDPDDKVTYKLVGEWGDVTGEIPCDGHDITDGPWGYTHPVVPGGLSGVELTDVPDGVALAYARLGLAP
jgi:hypothetical protein